MPYPFSFRKVLNSFSWTTFNTFLPWSLSSPHAQWGRIEACAEPGRSTPGGWFEEWHHSLLIIKRCFASSPGTSIQALPKYLWNQRRLLALLSDRGDYKKFFFGFGLLKGVYGFLNHKLLESHNRTCFILAILESIEFVLLNDLQYFSPRTYFDQAQHMLR